MKKRIIISVVLIALFGWSLYQNNIVPFSKSETSAPKKENKISESMNVDKKVSFSSLEVGGLAPNFDLRTIQGKSAQLDDYEGKPVLINFWATWCPPCRAEMPEIEEFYGKYKNDVVVLGINLTQTEASIDGVKAFVNEYNATFPVLLDEEMNVSTLYKVQGYPTSYFVDGKGIIRQKIVGAMSYDYMVNQLKEMR
ncbi:TlpA disulfide reductase family protein [Priestia koreensis]|uniref:TlpA disulfide reductase family protein n=1 Tax=Priestia koreensis TaxID=284581 RepID=UPI00345A1A30